MNKNSDVDTLATSCKHLILRTLLCDRGSWQVQNIAKTGQENYSDSPKAAFGRSKISTCQRAWWKLRLISCCGKVQIQTPPLACKFHISNLPVTTKYDHGREEADLKMCQTYLTKELFAEMKATYCTTIYSHCYQWLCYNRFRLNFFVDWKIKFNTWIIVEKGLAWRWRKHFNFPAETNLSTAISSFPLFPLFPVGLMTFSGRPLTPS